MQVTALPSHDEHEMAAVSFNDPALRAGSRFARVLIVHGTLLWSSFALRSVLQRRFRYQMNDTRSLLNLVVLIVRSLSVHLGSTLLLAHTYATQATALWHCSYWHLVWY